MLNKKSKPVPNFRLVFDVKQPFLTKPRPAIFLDRDGVINHNRTEHVFRWEDFHFEDGAVKAIQLLHRAGYPVIVITNQAGIERGLVGEHTVQELHRRMVKTVAKAGGQIKKVFYCPHRPETNCYCRKPQPGLLFQAAHQFNIQLTKSWFIGDHLTDVRAGLAAGCKPVLVLTGRGQEALKIWQQEQLQQAKASAQPPLFTVKHNLLEAVEYILATERATL